MSNKVTSGDQITEHFVNGIDKKNKELKYLISSLEEKLSLLKEKKDTNQPQDATVVDELSNVYYFDPSIRESFVKVAKSGMSSTLDVVIDLYVDWLIAVSTMAEINGKHYHKSKIMRNNLNELMDMLIPNAKNANKKADEFLEKAKAYIDYQKSQTATYSKLGSRDIFADNLEKDDDDQWI